MFQTILVFICYTKYEFVVSMAWRHAGYFFCAEYSGFVGACYAVQVCMLVPMRRLLEGGDLGQQTLSYPCRRPAACLGTPDLFSRVGT